MIYNARKGFGTIQVCFCLINFRVWGSDCLPSDLSSSTPSLCNLTQPLCASVSSSLKWDNR